MNIYLASKSPRRQELLKQIEIPYTLLSIDIPEEAMPFEEPVAYSKRITHTKLTTAWQTLLNHNLPLMPVLCADTEVILDNTILGKPKNEQEAFSMLKKYSERTHEVITSVGIKFDTYEKIELVKTLVTFSHLPDSEIYHYLSSGNYKDKAGAYGIQSYIGQFISHIEGCFYSVMGLPLNSVRILLDDLQSHLIK